MQRQATIAIAGLAWLGLFACGGETPTESRPITASIETNKPRAPIGSPVEITYRFDIGPDAAPIDKDYRVFVHFLDSHNALLFDDDHDPPKPTSSWTAGETLEYERTLFIPLYPYLGTASVVMGLWIPETGERLGLQGDDDGNYAYQVGQIELLDQKENIFLVYKEGWHQLESDLRNQHLRLDCRLGEQNRWGQKYEIHGPLRGPEGKMASVVSVWIILNDEENPRFVTAYPGAQA